MIEKTETGYKCSEADRYRTLFTFLDDAELLSVCVQVENKYPEADRKITLMLRGIDRRAREKKDMG